MIFTGFKRKTNQIFFNKKLIELQNKNEISSKGKIEYVLVVLDNPEIQEVIIKDLSEKLELKVDRFQVVIFKSKKDMKHLVENGFYPTDFGWYGKIKSDFLNTLLTKKYDLLISYNKVDNIYVNLLLLQCKSNFKVGFANLNEALFQLLIDCEKDNYKLFNEELKKYLTILKKL
jgi:hypothetical protein